MLAVLFCFFHLSVYARLLGLVVACVLLLEKKEKGVISAGVRRQLCSSVRTSRERFVREGRKESRKNSVDEARRGKTSDVNHETALRHKAAC